jgi:Cu-processing system permease protein
MKAVTLQIPSKFTCTREHDAGALIATKASRCKISPWRQVHGLACKEFADRFSNGWVLACVMVWLGVIGLTSFLGLLQIGRIGVQGYERTVLSLLNLVQYLVPLLGLLLGHDLLVGEKEDQTLRLLLARGLTRRRLLFGKFLGGCLTVTTPLLLGFVIAGAAIGFTTRDAAVVPFLRLALTSLALSIIFLSVGLLISTFSRTRVQALVLSLLAWGVAVFAFDLIALGIIVSSKVPSASHEIDLVCDATHVNAMADPHSGYDNITETKPKTTAASRASDVYLLMINPVDLFRAVNLSKQLEATVPAGVIMFATTFWMVGALSASFWKLTRTDL